MEIILLIQLLLALLAAASPSPSYDIDTVACHPDERDALLSFKNAFSNTDMMESWEKNGDCCKWDEVTCDSRSGHVVELHLSFSGLNGSFPSNTTLFRLPRLRLLDLGFNDLSGQAPPEIGWLSHLTTLDLSNNEQLKMPNFQTIIANLTDLSDLRLSYVSIATHLPPSIYNLSNLVHLYLMGCDLIGELPAVNVSWSMLTRVTTIDLSYNMLTGVIPNGIFEIHNLVDLSLKSNNLTGTIPLSRFHKLSHLTNLSLSDNSLTIVNDMDPKSTWPNLDILSLSSCKLDHFPVFLRKNRNLRTLELSNNDIHGEIPDWLFDIDTLEFLNLSHNSLQGGLEFIPRHSLYKLDIQSNKFHGAIPILPPSIWFFWGSTNHFSGAIPPSLCNAKSLELLDLAQNNLNGSIPGCFASLINNQLNLLDLRKNHLHGAVPSSLFQECFLLQAISLSGNKLEGQIPQSINNCSRLELLDLSSNNLNDKFPNWLEILPSLKVMILSSNKLHGSLTTSNSTSSFPMLQILDISNNAFTGTLPVELLMSMKAMSMVDNTLSLTYMRSDYSNYQDSIVTWIKGANRRLDAIYDRLVLIDASRNKLEGLILDAIGDLISLRGLNLAHNNFTGRIPPSLSNLSLLESLDLSFNRLEGGIPNELVNLNSLAFFNVSENNLVGPVPTTKQFGTFSDPSYLGNPNMCGPWLKKKCGKTSNTPPNSTAYEESGDESSSLQVWEIGLIGCGCGLLGGLAWGYVIFWANSPYWVQRLIFQIEAIVLGHQSRKRRNKRR